MYDVIVIGGGPAGVTAALHASEMGANTALVERSRLGGTCTNDGCVPTRVLARAARLARNAEQLEQYGLAPHHPEVDFERLMARTQQVVYTIHEKKQLIKHLEEHGVTVIRGRGSGRFLDGDTLEVGDPASNGCVLESQKFIISAGGYARRLNFPGAELALTHSDVWLLRQLPRSVVIVGAAATGCQVASIFAAFGSQVHLLDLAPRILPAEDEHTSQTMQAAFEQRGIRITTGIGGVERIERSEGGLRLHYTRGGEHQVLHSEAVVLSVGWPANLEGLNLPAAGVESAYGYIQVDDCLRTSAPHIYAAGDVNGRMMLVQSASYEGRVAAENAVLGTERSFRHQIVPHGGFTDPEYGSVGLTESQAQTGEEYAMVVVPYSDLDRAVIDGMTNGFCKLIVSRTSHKVLGAHVVGEQALEIVHLVAAGMASGMTVGQLADLEIAYPTYTAVVGLAARKLTRELKIHPLAAQWQALGRVPLSEWERSDGWVRR
jgi:pyruvate/2-oxoglutarate dehydrogenase complex dihydrolipoamide dehydrogenase (E3) component